MTVWTKRRSPLETLSFPESTMSTLETKVIGAVVQFLREISSDVPLSPVRHPTTFVQPLLVSRQTTGYADDVT